MTKWRDTTFVLYNFQSAIHSWFSPIKTSILEVHMLCVSFLATVTYISRIFCFCFSFLCWSAEVEKGTYFNFAGALNAVYLSRHVSMDVWEIFFFCQFLNSKCLELHSKNKKYFQVPFFGASALGLGNRFEIQNRLIGRSYLKSVFYFTIQNWIIYHS